MSLILVEGWDLYGTASNVVVGNWTEMPGTPVINLTGGKFNDPHVVLNSTGDILRKDHTTITNSDGLIIGAQYKTETLVQQRVFNFTDSNNNDGELCYLRLETDGSLSFLETEATDDILAATASGVIVAGVWHTIELKVIPSTAFASIANADGYVQCRVDGTIRFTASNLVIGPADTGSPRPVGIGKTELRGGTGVAHFGDVYMFNVSGVLNNDFAGDFRVQTLIPASDTATASWTPLGAGDHYVEVDDGSSPDGDSSYISSQVTNDADIFELTDLSGDVGAILGYSPLVLARRETGSTQNIAVRLIGSSETVNFSSKNLATTYEYRFDLRSGSVDDPTNSTYPDVAEVNALQGGVYIP